jgi:hypothetical protein
VPKLALFLKSVVNVGPGVRKGKAVKPYTRVQASGKPLAGHPYHDKSDEELKYIMKDAGEASRLHDQMHGGMSAAARDVVHNKYADQVNDAATVLHYRSKQAPTFHVSRVEDGDSYIDSTHAHFGAATKRMMDIHKEDARASPQVEHHAHGIMAFPHTETPGKVTVTPAYKRAKADAAPEMKERWADG